MKTISFILKSSVLEAERTRALKRILEHPNCSKAQYLSDDIGRSAWRIGHAYAEDDVAEELKGFIASVPEIESVEIEILRKLIP